MPKWILPVLIGAAALAAIAAAVWFFVIVPSVTRVDSVAVTDIGTDYLTVQIESGEESGAFDVTCSDAYGNQSRKAYTAGEDMTFDSLMPGTQYTIEAVPLEGKKMTGSYSATASTFAETKILSFTATPISITQAELNFIQHGWDEKFEDQPQYKYSRTINYFELPILTHIYFGSKRFRVFVNLGPKIGYAFGEKTDENLNGAKPNTENEQHDMPIEKKFDWGLCGGPGIELRTGIGSFLLEGRYYYALGDIFNSRKEDYFSKSSSQVISAKITYMIPGF